MRYSMRAYGIAILALSWASLSQAASQTTQTLIKSSAATSSNTLLVKVSLADVTLPKAKDDKGFPTDSHLTFIAAMIGLFGAAFYQHQLKVKEYRLRWIESFRQAVVDFIMYINLIHVGNFSTPQGAD